MQVNTLLHFGRDAADRGLVLVIFFFEDTQLVRIYASDIFLVLKIFLSRYPKLSTARDDNIYN